ncbi:MAG TPA: aspartate 1-decarboxylase [Clostridia bacterium]|nr:aspartate 1-decarboxylase [Clostridia bacterium]
MYRQMCKAKIHRATVTEANLNYVGSITIDRKLLEAADILPYEKVQVVNLNNGSRLETYAIAGEANSGIVCLNGAAARLVQKGDLVIIIAYALVEEKDLADFNPRVVFVDKDNRVEKIVAEEIHGLAGLAG